VWAEFVTSWPTAGMLTGHVGRWHFSVAMCVCRIAGRIGAREPAAWAKHNRLLVANLAQDVHVHVCRQTCMRSSCRDLAGVLEAFHLLMRGNSCFRFMACQLAACWHGPVVCKEVTPNYSQTTRLTPASCQLHDSTCSQLATDPHGVLVRFTL
jgi:hypothetical protein